MPLSESVISDLAERLALAETSRVPIAQFSAQFPEMSVADAYEVQRAWIRLKCARGRKPIGRKIGLTSRAMQRAVNITEPDYGVLLDDMLFENGADIPIGRFIEPRVEVELAFVLSKPLCGEAVTLFDVLDAVDYVCPAIEIIDARIERFDRTTQRTRSVIDTISDNAANAGLVLGGRPVRPHDLDLRWQAAILYRNGVIEESGVAAAVLNNPVHGPAWLARKLAAYGDGLEPGDVILGGSFTAPIHAREGDVFHIDFAALGSISMRFA